MCSGCTGERQQLELFKQRSHSWGVWWSPWPADLFKTISGKYSTEDFFSANDWWMFSSLLTHWDGCFDRTCTSQGSQVIPTPLLANPYMAPTIGQLCSLGGLFRVVVTTTLWIGPMNYVHSIDRKTESERGEVLTMWSLKVPRPLQWVPKVKTLFILIQNCYLGGFFTVLTFHLV